jgi:hypothetical protein
MKRQPRFRIYKTFQDGEWAVLFIDGLSWAGFESSQQAQQFGKARAAELWERMADAVSARQTNDRLKIQSVEVGSIE